MQLREDGRPFAQHRARISRPVIAISFICLFAAAASAQDLESGKAVYQRNCAQCHGTHGTPYRIDPKNPTESLRDPKLSMPLFDPAAAPAAEFEYPRPRDFTKGVFKFRTTPSGEMPTEADLLRTVKEGLPGTAMPGWKDVLTENQIQDVVAVIMGYSDRFKKEKPTSVLSIGTPPAVATDTINQGRDAYLNLGCVNCHGLEGRGDGAVGLYRRDKVGDDVLSAENLHQRWNFHGGSRVEDIFRTLMTGLTLMPAFADTLGTGKEGEAKIWNLAQYVFSLSKDKPNLNESVSARFVDKIPAAPDDPFWDGIEAVDFPMAGQIIQPPRYFNATVNMVSVKAAYNDSDIALLLQWDDPRENYGPPDIFQLQFPMTLSADGSKPYFLEGDAKNPANLWRWDAATKQVFSFKSTGLDSHKSMVKSKDKISAATKYQMGTWRLLITRRRRVPAAGGISFDPGQRIPIAFAAWDGDREPKEEGPRHSLSAWYSLVLEPKEKTDIEPPKPAPAPEDSPMPKQIAYKGKTLELEALKNPYAGLQEKNAGEFSKIVREGKAVYFSKCFFCHGDNYDGKGQFAENFNPPPKNFREPGWVKRRPEPYMFWRIVKGGPGRPPESHPWDSAMPAWEHELSNDQVWKVITFIRSIENP